MAPAESEKKKVDPTKRLLVPMVGSNGFQGVQGVHPVMRSAKSPGVVSTGSKGIGGGAPAGRPVKNLGDYLIKPTTNSDTGFEMLNDQPDLLKQVQQRYLKAGELPPALQPKYLRKPEVLERGATGRATKISRGWRAPRSLH